MRELWAPTWLRATGGDGGGGYGTRIGDRENLYGTALAITARRSAHRHRSRWGTAVTAPARAAWRSAARTSGSRRSGRGAGPGTQARYRSTILPPGSGT